jgi:hypothetical protein
MYPQPFDLNEIVSISFDRVSIFSWKVIDVPHSNAINRPTESALSEFPA